MGYNLIPYMNAAAPILFDHRGRVVWRKKGQVRDISRKKMESVMWALHHNQPKWSDREKKKFAVKVIAMGLV